MIRNSDEYLLDYSLLMENLVEISQNTGQYEAPCYSSGEKVSLNVFRLFVLYSNRRRRGRVANGEPLEGTESFNDGVRFYRPLKQKFSSASIDPVSYTHLTLPTICSV